MAARVHHAASSQHADVHASGQSSGHSKASSKLVSSTRVVSSTRHTKSKRAVAVKRVRGQQAIDSERVTQIQQALIREHYLDQDANGEWDGTTVAAMQKYQADHGWQTKLMPDSRALKTLGLGPDYSSAINAKDGNFLPPPPISSIPTDQAAGFAAGARVSQ